MDMTYIVYEYSSGPTLFSLASPLGDIAVMDLSRDHCFGVFSSGVSDVEIRRGSDFAEFVSPGRQMRDKDRLALMAQNALQVRIRTSSNARNMDLPFVISEGSLFAPYCTKARVRLNVDNIYVLPDFQVSLDIDCSMSMLPSLYSDDGYLKAPDVPADKLSNVSAIRIAGDIQKSKAMNLWAGLWIPLNLPHTGSSGLMKIESMLGDGVCDVSIYAEGEHRELKVGNEIRRRVSWVRFGQKELCVSDRVVCILLDRSVQKL